MSYKPISNSYIIWSPNSDNKFIKVSLRQIDLYEIQLNQLDENLSLNTHIKKLACYNEIENIKTVSWQVSKTDENHLYFDDIIAIGLTNGIIKFINLIQISGEPNQYNLAEKELRPKFLKSFLYISWNPWIKNMLAQVIDRSKIPASSNEASILIWDFQKSNENKALTPTINQVNLAARFVQQQIVSGTSQGSQNKSSISDIGADQPIYEYCRGDVVNSFCWLSQSQFICSVNNKYLKIFEVKGQNPLKVVNTDAAYNLCIDVHQSNIISSFVDEKIVIWKEESLDKPILTYVEEAPIENIEWSPLRHGYICVTFKDKPFVKVLDTKTALINVLNEMEHTLIDRHIRSTYEVNIVSATWHRQIENCILLLLADDRFELVHLRVRSVIAWSVLQKFVYTLETYLKICPYRKEIRSDSNLSAKNSDQCSKTKFGKLERCSNDSLNSNIGFYNDNNQIFFTEKDAVMQQRAQNGYGLKSQLKEYSYSSMFNDNSELKSFWMWIENASNNCHYNSETFGNKIKSNPFSGAIEGIYDVATVTVNRNTSEIKFKLNANVSREEEVRWNHMYDNLPFPKYTHSFRTKIFFACNWPFDQNIEKWRYILESLDNKERAAAMALVTLNFDVALQYLKRIPNDKVIDSEILRLCLAGFNTQSGQTNNPYWSAICKDVLKRLDNNHPYLKLIFNFLIVKNKTDLQFIRSLNILLIDKLAIAALYMDDESLIDFFNHISNFYLINGQLEVVALTGLKSREFTDLLQAYVNRTADIQTAAIAVLQANILTRNAIEKSKRLSAWVECYRSLLDNWQLWLVRADFDIANQYIMFNTNKEVIKTTKPQAIITQKPNSIILSSIASHNQVYVACGFCGWKISQSSKYTTNLNRNSIQNKTRPDGSLYGTTNISSLAMHAGGCKSTICQHCRKPLPRCSVCLMNMGINGDTTSTANAAQLSMGIYSQKDDQLPSNPIDYWFMWCQKCKHGGHTGHLQQWFVDSNECPVSGCKCTCCDLDSPYSLVSVHGQKCDLNSIDLF